MIESALQSHKADPTSQGPRVLVGIVTRNRSEILPDAIESALSQNCPRVEVAVLDDGSQDRTFELRHKYRGVQWYRWSSSRGYLEARNHLMRHTDAEFYLSLDDDARFVTGDEISVAVNYLQANTGVAVVAFDILSPDRAQPVPRSAPLPTHLFIGCGHVARMSAIRAAGYYEPSPGYYGSEEKDLCLRLLDIGWELRLLPGVHVWHEKTVLARDVPEQYRSLVCNDLALALRRCPVPLLFLVFPVKLINHFRFAAGHRLLGAFLNGLKLFGRCGLTIWRSRKPVRPGIFMFRPGRAA